MYKLVVLAAIAAAAFAEDNSTADPGRPTIGTTSGNLEVEVPENKHAIFKRTVSSSVSLFDVVTDLNELKAEFADAVSQRKAAEAQLNQTVQALNSAVEMITKTTTQFGRIDDVVAAQAQSAKDVAALVAKQSSDLAGSLSDANDKLLDLSTSLAQDIAANSAAADQLSKSLKDDMKALKAELTALTAASIKKAEDETTTAIAKVKSDTAKKLSDSLGPVTKLSECAQKGQMYDKAAGVCRTVMWERFWNNNWGSEHGYVPNRRLTFTKYRDDTDLKITYYDNMRVHGHHWCRAAWYVEIDRKECTDPGRISFDKYSHQQHNYWMNDHIGGSAHGVCRSTSRGRIGAGKHTVEVRLYTQRCDTYTGHNGQGGYLLVEEIMSNKVTN